MKYDVCIRYNLTGETAIYHSELDWIQKDCDGEEFDGSYWWTEGNGGCDCNREIYFMSAKGLEIPAEHICGETRYSIPYVVLEDGTKIKIEDC